MKCSCSIIINEIHALIGNKNISEIINLENDNIYNKSAISMIIKQYIDKKSIYNLDVLKDHQIQLKFIPVSLEYKCHEAMSFITSSLYDIQFEDWESNDPFQISSLRKQLKFNFLFIPIIKIKTNGNFNNYLDWQIGDFSFWLPNEKELELIGNEWLNTKKIIQNGIKIKTVNYGNSYRTSNNLPKQSETKFIHLRPHAKNSFDYDLKYLKHVGIEITKQSFWLNKNFINKLLDKYKWKTNLKEE